MSSSSDASNTIANNLINDVASNNIKNNTRQTPVAFDNFFALFDFPVQFDIDRTVLEQRLRDLQQRYHPDNLSASSVQTSNNKNSALINHAYQTLRYADSRASYLLEMQGQDAELNNSISDLDFLESAMELRIELDEAQDVSTLAGLTDAVNAQLSDYAAQFKSAFKAKQWQSAIDATQKLKFLVKLNKDIDQQTDSLLNVDDGDDDLYV